VLDLPLKRGEIRLGGLVLNLLRMVFWLLLAAAVLTGVFFGSNLVGYSLAVGAGLVFLIEISKRKWRKER